MDISQELVKAQEHEDEIARCETIVNITSAELERVHKEKLEDFKWAAEEYLRTQIEFHERVSFFFSSFAVQRGENLSVFQI